MRFGALQRVMSPNEEELRELRSAVAKLCAGIQQGETILAVNNKLISSIEDASRGSGTVSQERGAPSPAWRQHDVDSIENRGRPNASVP